MNEQPIEGLLFCPHCGEQALTGVKLDRRGRGPAEYYDCYCPECQWSGDISPDTPLS